MAAEDAREVELIIVAALDDPPTGRRFHQGLATDRKIKLITLGEVALLVPSRGVVIQTSRQKI
jgi:hypothetical protein